MAIVGSGWWVKSPCAHIRTPYVATWLVCHMTVWPWPLRSFNQLCCGQWVFEKYICVLTGGQGLLNHPVRYSPSKPCLMSNLVAPATNSWGFSVISCNICCLFNNNISITYEWIYCFIQITDCGAWLPSLVPPPWALNPFIYLTSQILFLCWTTSMLCTVALFTSITYFCLHFELNYWSIL
jgi:hypothetical protein